MSPEYGATIAICPIDDMTLDYLRLTARDDAQVAAGRGLRQGAGALPDRRVAADPIYTQSVEFDLTMVEPSLAGTEASAGPRRR